jgi:hypothetical protein
LMRVTAVRRDALSWLSGLIEMGLLWSRNLPV